MAQTSVGFAGTVNDAEWAVLSSFLGNQACVSSQASLAVTPVGGARSVSVAAGVAYGDGVQTTLSASETVALTTPTNGQWYLVVLRRVWATKVSSLVAIAHTTTTTTVPTSAPTTYPAGMLAQPGIQSDQPLAWAWCNSANTTVVTSDLRQQPIRTIIQQPNVVINGGMDIWQRGTIFNGAGLLYCADRWTYWRDAYAAGITASRQLAGLPDGKYCLRIQRDSGNANTGLLYTNQPITNDDSLALIGKTVTLSAWIRKGANFSGGAVNMLVRSGTGTDQPVNNMTGATTVVSEAKTLTENWQRFYITGTVSASATQLGIEFNYTPSGTAGANDYFEVRGVQLEAGAFATPFRRNGASIAGELAACQRFYEKTYAMGTVPGTATTFGFYSVSIGSDGNNNAVIAIRFTVPKRVAPTMTAYLPSSGATGLWGWQRSGTGGASSVNFDLTTEFGSRAYIGVGAAWAVCNVDAHWTASAEI